MDRCYSYAFHRFVFCFINLGLFQFFDFLFRRAGSYLIHQWCPVWGGTGRSTPPFHLGLPVESLLTLFPTPPAPLSPPKQKNCPSEFLRHVYQIVTTSVPLFTLQRKPSIPELLLEGSTQNGGCTCLCRCRSGIYLCTELWEPACRERKKLWRIWTHTHIIPKRSCYGQNHGPGLYS